MRQTKITARGSVVADSFAIADPDYLYAAKIVIEHYGQGAASHCAKRANHLLRIGDMDGNTVWRRILAAIEELQRRCLIPTSGFYEWLKMPHGKQPYLIRFSVHSSSALLASKRA